MTFIADILPSAQPGFFRRQWLLLRQEFRAWRLPLLFTCLLCVLAIETVRSLHISPVGDGAGWKLCWSFFAAPAAEKTWLSAEGRLAVWAFFLTACLLFFCAGTFADLSRAQTRQHWLLLPAPLWEKLLSRWLCSAVLFPALALGVSAGWFLLRNTDPQFRQWLADAAPALSRPKELLDLLLTLGSAHAVVFFLAGALRTKSRTLPAFVAVFFLLGLLVDKAGWDEAGAAALCGGLLLLWPLTWVVFKRSRA